MVQQRTSSKKMRMAESAPLPAGVDAPPGLPAPRRTAQKKAIQAAKKLSGADAPPGLPPPPGLPTIEEFVPGIEATLDSPPGLSALAHDDAVSNLRAELNEMKKGALRRRAAGLGIDEDTLEAADDAEDTKQAFIELIILHSVASKQDVAVSESSGSTTVGDTEATPPATPKLAACSENEMQVMTGESYQVRLSGLPNEILSDIMFRAVLHQAQLSISYSSFTTTPGKKYGEAVVNLTDAVAAEWCVHHFSNRSWSEDGSYTSAWLVSQSSNVDADTAGTGSADTTVVQPTIITPVIDTRAAAHVAAAQAAAAHAAARASKAANKESWMAAARSRKVVPEEAWLEAWFNDACSLASGEEFSLASIAENAASDEPLFVPETWRVGCGLSAEAPEFVPCQKTIRSLDHKLMHNSDVSTVASDDESRVTEEQAVLHPWMNIESDEEQTLVEVAA